MGSISVEQFLEHPYKLLSEAQGGESPSSPRTANPYSWRSASGIAGLVVSEMIDELGRRRIPVVRYTKEEFAEELKHVRGLSGRR